jgi:hypothetical protein
LKPNLSWVGYIHDLSDLPYETFVAEVAERDVRLFVQGHSTEDALDRHLGDIDVKVEFQRQGYHSILGFIGDSVIWAATTSTFLNIQVGAETLQEARFIAQAFASRFPVTEVTDDGLTQMNFWALGPMGPVERTRRINTNRWSDIKNNYPTDTPDRLSEIMDLTPPFDSGRLMLWHGEPGTGKTHAIRSLARTWTPWCDFHYIVDPDAFFDQANYMMDVLLHEGDEPNYVGDGYVLKGPERWKLLLVEDADEFMRADAKQRSGQSLSRLLNVADGLIGQGLNVLLLISTNEKLASIHPAVSREGRCLAEIEFGKFSASEASAWLGANVDSEASLAQLFERQREQHQVVSTHPTLTGQYL